MARAALHVAGIAVPGPVQRQQYPRSRHRRWAWRAQRRAGALQALAPQKRGPKPDPQAAEIARLRRENERLQQRLQRAETIIEVQKKLSALLGLPTSESDEQL